MSFSKLTGFEFEKPILKVKRASWFVRPDATGLERRGDATQVFPRPLGSSGELPKGKRKSKGGPLLIRTLNRR